MPNLYLTDWKFFLISVALNARLYNSTRIISSDASYAEIKAAILKFSYDCLNEAVNTESIRNLYDEKYSSIKLLNKWEDLLIINRGNK